MDNQAIESSKSISPLFEIVSDSLNDGIIIINEAGQITFINKVCRDCFDVNEKEPVGKFLNEIFPEKFHVKADDKFIPRLKKVLGKGTEIVVFDDNGNSSILYLRMEDIFNGLYLLVFRDISSIKEQDKLLADEVIKRSNLEESNFILKERVRKASQLNKAALPATSLFDVFRESFIFHQPKIELGSDHYYLEQFDNQFIFAIYDCNDIGVAGGFHSLIVKTHLDHLITSGDVEPSEVLSQLNSRLIADEAKNGYTNQRVQITLCHIDLETKTVKYAAAKSPLLVIGNGFYKEVIGNQKPLPIREDFKALQREFVLQPNETIFFHTDGINQQLNEKGEQLDRARLIEMLLNQNSDSLAKQHEILEYEINHWRGHEEQTDDITVIGLRF